MTLSDISNLLPSFPVPPLSTSDHCCSLLIDKENSINPALRRVSTRLRTKSEVIKPSVSQKRVKVEVSGVRESEETIEILRRRFTELKRENEDLKTINEVVSERERVEKDHSTIAYNKIKSERDYLRDALGSAQNEVLHHDTELEVLREALQASNHHLKDARNAKEFAEAETQSMRVSLEEKDVEIVTQLANISQLVLNCEDVRSQLGLAQRDLHSALSRETQQIESSRALMMSRQELELAYDDALAQLENWRKEQGFREEGYGREYMFGDTPTHENEEEELENFPLSDNDDTRSYNTSLDGFDIVDFRREFLNSSLSLGQKSSASTTRRSSFRAKIRNLVHPRLRSKPSPQAVKLFAIKELEDDLLAYKLQLTLLVDDFTQTESHKLQRLQRLQTDINQSIKVIRITATKLKAVRSFEE